MKRLVKSLFIQMEPDLLPTRDNNYLSIIKKTKTLDLLVSPSFGVERVVVSKKFEKVFLYRRRS